MKIFLAFFFMFYSCLGLSQKKYIYFPQELLIHPECTTADDKNTCLKEIVEKRVFALLNEKKNLKSISKRKKDTLSIEFTIVVTEKGLINKKSSNTSIRLSKDYKKIEKGLKQILNSLPVFKVLNRKNDPTISKHYLNFRYLIKKQESLVELQEIKNEEEYSGGVIEEIPVFPGCENLSQSKASYCFKKMMGRHIESNFTYPEIALQNGISGTVLLWFIINKEGKPTRLRMRSPYPILDKEAARIIGLLPEFKPGLRNGKPGRYAFSVPITFTLNKNDSND